MFEENTLLRKEFNVAEDGGTYVYASRSGVYLYASFAGKNMLAKSTKTSLFLPLKISNLYSDAFFKIWACSGNPPLYEKPAPVMYTIFSVATRITNLT